MLLELEPVLVGAVHAKQVMKDLTVVDARKVTTKLSMGHVKVRQLKPLSVKCFTVLSSFA